MVTYEFTIAATGNDSPDDFVSFLDWMDDIAEQLAERLGGEPDVNVSGSAQTGLELGFYRDADTLEDAVSTALKDIQAVGLRPTSICFEGAPETAS
ncbi:MAG: hypothetical protein O3A00_22680, partial [Planctomycetota bacterium]|nr:hypothetical protein [Planctomycetota bacterium]